jgi:dTDP-4-amino-4,6-dideoxygalactose transaminase
MRSNFQSYAVRVTPAFGMSRDQLMQELLERGISTRRGIMNSHQEPPYANARPWKLPNSEAARDGVILLPLYHQLSDDEQSYVIESLRSLARNI